MRKHPIRSGVVGGLVALPMFLLGVAAAVLSEPEKSFDLLDAFQYRNETRTREDFLVQVVRPRLINTQEPEIVSFIGEEHREDPDRQELIRPDICRTIYNGKNERGGVVIGRCRKIN